MIALLLALTIIILQSVLLAFTVSRAWNLRTTRLYAILAVTIILIAGSAALRDRAVDDPNGVYPLLILTVAATFYPFMLTLLISAIFLPQWWEGRRPIRWISLPYVLILGLVIIDMWIIFPLQGSSIFVSSTRIEDGFVRFNLNFPATGIILFSSLIGLGINVISTSVVAVREPENRNVAILTALTIVISLVATPLSTQLSMVARYTNLLQIVPVIALFTFLILRTQYFTPVQAALVKALATMSEVLAVLDREGRLGYANAQAKLLGLREGEPLMANLQELGVQEHLALSLNQELRQQLFINNQIYDFQLSPVSDRITNGQGWLLLARNISDVVERQQQLESERSELRTTVKALEVERNERLELAGIVRQLALPLLPVLPGVLVLPLIGEFEDTRIEDFLNTLLEGIERERAHTVLIDITGITILDTQGTQGLFRGIQAAKLLGANCILIGVRPEIAQSLVTLGVPVSELNVARSLESALSRLVAR